METNWIVVAIVVIIGVALIVCLIRKNMKDEKDVVAYFNQESSHFNDEEEELNDEK